MWFTKQVKNNKTLVSVSALQVQFINSLVYLQLWSTTMLALTFWHTTGANYAVRYIPWFNFGYFALFGVCWVCFVMWFDYKFILPSRMAFNNIQTCKTENPAMALMIDMNNKQIAMKHDTDEINRSLAAIILELKEIKEEIRD